MFSKVNNSYEHALAHVYHKIDKRGILVDEVRLAALRKEVESEIKTLCITLTNNWNIFIYCGGIRPDIQTVFNISCNINSSSGDNSLLNTLKKLGYKVPIVRKKNQDKEWIMKESADELALQRMFADTGDVNLKHLMRVKELTKLLSSYINAKLHRSILYSSYGVASTVTGRRGCSKHPFGFGANAQTFPSHTLDRFTHEYRRCLIARTGAIFFSVDQKSAEEYPQAALAGNTQAIKELNSTEWPENDRHTRLASFTFGVPVDRYSKKEWKDIGSQAGMMRYVGGKKARHANAYGMRKNRFSEVLAKEGFSFSPQACETILNKVNQYDPSIQQVYHKYVQNEIEQNRMLVTPLGRERQFFAFRPNSDNWEVWNEAYAYIPQSVVGDNTGLAVLNLSLTYNNNFIINEAHDSIVQELPDEMDVLERVFKETSSSFHRNIRFYNGIEINIPIEAKLSYNFEDEVSLRDYSIESLHEAYNELKQKYPPIKDANASQVVVVA